ncbi:MAG: signal peptide peptidase SppA [Kiritimatiellae bacterium]|nr:signal peptide peptidase SppA [Kiritimatiellia bacterium]
MKPSPNPSRAERRWPLRFLWVLLCSALVVSLFLNCAAWGIASSETSDNPEDEFPDLSETASYGTDGPKVVRIPLQGTIAHEGAESFFGVASDPVESLLRQIRAASNDEEVRGILLEVDSPGGGVTASDEIYHELLQFKAAATNRAIVGLAQDMAASGAYYVLMAADAIVAQPTAMIGSIGVIISGVNASGLAERFGVRDATVASGPNKDLLNPLKPVDEQHVAILRAAVDADYERFLSLVAKGRGKTADELRPLCDGRVLSAAAALEAGLVDAIGYREDALALLASKLGDTEVRAVKYEESKSFLDNLFSVRSPVAPVLSRLGLGTPSRREYRWAP